MSWIQPWRYPGRFVALEGSEQLAATLMQPWAALGAARNYSRVKADPRCLVAHPLGLDIETDKPPEIPQQFLRMRVYLPEATDKLLRKSHVKQIGRANVSTEGPSSGNAGFNYESFVNRGYHNGTDPVHHPPNPITYLSTQETIFHKGLGVLEIRTETAAVMSS